MKVLLVDDHPLILAAMQSVMARLGPQVEATSVGSAREAKALLERQADYDLLLLDLLLGDANGIDVLVELRDRWPALPVVVVSASDRASDVIRAIDAGAMGYVPKRASNDMLIEALHLVMSGGLYIPPMAPSLSQPPSNAPVQVVGPAGAMGPVSTRSLSAMVEMDEVAMDEAREPRPDAADRASLVPLESLGLTPRQCEVLALLLQGKANKVIARELGLSVETIKDHVAAVLRSLGVSSRTQAVLVVNQIQQTRGGAMRLMRT
ncbi:LuxR family two component transcriptional regulator [Sphaerotilus hippei]|uniref:LuxR family two component transcriptional regulator n=1 Tax=Sphaerotilus hippei TaxID=744406 RepID=A0A318H0S4_9BURK|nr:response regulator transcription factor [Sphaerotilus hippei]PXW96538.1 LuxR family two component transcriptional regulator [Sphaerotilus hippei]